MAATDAMMPGAGMNATATASPIAAAELDRAVAAVTKLMRPDVESLARSSMIDCDETWSSPAPPARAPPMWLTSWIDNLPRLALFDLMTKFAQILMPKLLNPTRQRR